MNFHINCSVALKRVLSLHFSEDYNQLPSAKRFHQFSVTCGTETLLRCRQHINRSSVNQIYKTKFFTQFNSHYYLSNKFEESWCNTWRHRKETFASNTDFKHSLYSPIAVIALTSDPSFWAYTWTIQAHTVVTMPITGRWKRLKSIANY